MSNKDILSKTDFTTPEEKTELLGQSLRNSAVPNDSFNGKTVFKAIVLKLSAKAMSADTVSAMIGTSEQKLPRTDVNSKFDAYRVRIIDDNSPHAFLPIPCDIGTSATPSNHLLINMHTMVFKKSNSEAKSLSPGDIVDIRLTPKDFSYDLNYGVIVSDKLSHNSDKLSSEKGVPCISSAGSFEFNQNIFSIGELADRSSTAPAYVVSNTGIPNVAVVGPQLLTLAMIGYLADLKGFMDKNDIGIPLRITSGYRSPEKQAEIMYKYPGGASALRKLYGNTPQIEKFISAKRKSLAAAQEVVKQYHDIGINFSKHQQSLGFDLRSKDLSNDQLTKLMNAIRQTGGRPLFEPLKCSQGGSGGSPSKRGCKNEHIHVGVPARYAALTQEQVDERVSRLDGYYPESNEYAEDPYGESPA